MARSSWPFVLGPLSKSTATWVQRSCVQIISRASYAGLNSFTDILPTDPPHTHIDVKNGKNCIFITGVLQYNVHNVISTFQHHKNIPVTGATFFDQNSGLGNKSGLLLHLAEPEPWKNRFQNYRPPHTRKAAKELPVDIVSVDQLNPQILHTCKDISDQISCIYEFARVPPEIGLFHGCFISMLNDCLQESDPDIFNGELQPFGSAACGMALQGSSDLDLVYIDNGDLKKYEQVNLLRRAAACFRQINYLKDMVYILRARTPIIRFQEFSTGLSVDVSASERFGVDFAALFCRLKDFDDRIYPLIICVRFWSKVNKLKCIQLSNFVLTLLVIAFLQTQKIIPPLKNLVEGDLQVEVSLNQNSRKGKKETQERESLGDLLIGFFQFYSKFDHNKMSVNLREGMIERKIVDKFRVGREFHMENPYFESTTLNIGKNVTDDKFKEFVNLCKTSHMLLESEKSEFNSKEEWGLNLTLPCTVLP